MTMPSHHGPAIRRALLLVPVGLLTVMTMIGARSELRSWLDGRVHAALVSRGIEGARFTVRDVGVDRARLSDVRLGEDFSAEEVVLDYGLEDLLASRVAVVTLVRPRWRLALDGASLRASAPYRLAMANGSTADGDGDREAPSLRVIEGRVTVRASDEPGSGSLDLGGFDPGAMDPVPIAVEGALDAMGDGSFAVHASLGGAPPVLAHVTVDRGGAETVVGLEGSTPDGRDTFSVRARLRDFAPTLLSGSFDLERASRADWGPRLAARVVHVEWTGALDGTRLVELDVTGDARASSIDDVALGPVALRVERAGELLSWSLDASTEGGPELRVTGTLPSDLRALGSAELRVPMYWTLVGPLSERWVSERLRRLGVDEGAVALSPGSSVALEATSTLALASGGPLVIDIDDLHVELTLSGVRADAADVRLDDVRAELWATGVAGPDGLALDFDERSSVRVARGRVRDFRALGLDVAPRVRLEADDAGLRVIAPQVDMRFDTLAVGSGDDQVRVGPAALTARVRSDGSPLVSWAADRLRFGARVDARAGRVRGMLVGARARLVGNVTGAIGTGPQAAREAWISAPSRVTAARLSHPSSHFELSDAALAIRLTAGLDVVDTGRLTAGEVSWRGHGFGGTSGSFEVAAKTVGFDMRTPIGTTAARLSATIRHGGRDGGVMDIELPVSVLDSGHPLAELFADLADVSVTGPVGGEIHLDLSEPERGRARVVLRGATVADTEGRGSAHGVTGTMDFLGLEPLASASSSRLRFSELRIGEHIRTDAGAAVLRVEPAGSIAMEDLQVAALGGQFRVAPFRFVPSGRELPLQVSVVGLELAPLLRGVSDRATADGQVDGYVALRLGLGPRPSVVLEGVRFAARGGGRFAVRDPEVARSMAASARNVTPSAVARRIVAALADFQYRHLSLDLRDREGEAVLGARVIGCGLKTPQGLDLTLSVRGIQQLLDEAMAVDRSLRMPVEARLTSSVSLEET